MTDSIYARLTDVFHDVFDDDSLTLNANTRADDVEGWDSLTHIRLMLNVERAFKITLTASEIGKLTTVGDLVELIARKST